MATSLLRLVFAAWATRHNYKVVRKLETQGDTRLTQSSKKGEPTGEWTVEVAWPGGSGQVCEGVGRHYPVLDLTEARAVEYLSSH